MRAFLSAIAERGLRVTCPIDFVSDRTKISRHHRRFITYVGGSRKEEFQRALVAAELPLVCLGLGGKEQPGEDTLPLLAPFFALSALRFHGVTWSLENSLASLCAHIAHNRKPTRIVGSLADLNLLERCTGDHFHDCVSGTVRLPNGH